MKKAAALHLVGVLLEAALPIGWTIAASIRKVHQDPRGNIGLGNLSQADISYVRKRNHYGHAVIKEFEKVKSLELLAKCPGTDIFDGPDALVGINHFFTDHEGHTETSLNTGAECY